jgi:hypothetical protein
VRLCATLNRMIKHISSALLFVSAIGVCGARGSDQILTQEPARAVTSDDLDQALSWLPADTETINVARGPFVLAAPPTHNWTPQTWDPNRAVPDQELAEDFEYFSLQLFHLTNGSLFTRLQGKRVVLAVEGSRHFRAPAGLGLMPFEGCLITMFADELSDVASSFTRETRKAALRVEEIEGQQILVFQEKEEEDTWTTFVAFPNEHVVLIASNRDFLREVITRLKGHQGKRAIPNDTPEWRYVDAGAQFWGVRHYDRSQAKMDPSSPFGGRKSANVPDEQGIGITFVFDPRQGRSATITYLSGNKGIAENPNASLLTMRQSREAKGLDIRCRALGPGIVQGSYSLNQIESTDFFLFVLEGFLGHAVYL